MLQNAGADLEVQTLNGNTPLHYAAKYGHVPIMQFLSLKETKLNVKNQIGWTPFHMAARFGQAAAVKELAALGGASEEADTLGLTPRDLAETNGHKDVVEFIDTPPESAQEK